MNFFDMFHWQWLILAVVLLILEAIAPGAIFIWMGVSAAAVGVLTWIIPSLSGAWQILIFAILSMATVGLWRLYLKRYPQKSAMPLLNRRMEGYIGKTLTLSSALKDGKARAKLGDTWWTIEGPDLPAGARVVIVGVEGPILKVREQVRSR